MNARRRIAALCASTALGAAALIGVTATPALAANCAYRAIDDVQVRENPSINSEVVKTKPYDSVMTGDAEFCNAQVGTDGRRWYWVYTDSASDGIGWVIENKVIRASSA